MMQLFGCGLERGFLSSCERDLDKQKRAWLWPLLVQVVHGSSFQEAFWAPFVLSSLSCDGGELGSVIEEI